MRNATNPERLGPDGYARPGITLLASAHRYSGWNASWRWVAAGIEVPAP